MLKLSLLLWRGVAHPFSPSRPLLVQGGGEFAFEFAYLIHWCAHSHLTQIATAVIITAARQTIDRTDQPRGVSGSAPCILR
jgi:hypothetical protein